MSANLDEIDQIVALEVVAANGHQDRLLLLIDALSSQVGFAAAAAMIGDPAGADRLLARINAQILEASSGSLASVHRLTAGAAETEAPPSIDAGKA